MWWFGAKSEGNIWHNDESSHGADYIRILNRLVYLFLTSKTNPIKTSNSHHKRCKNQCGTLALIHTHWHEWIMACHSAFIPILE